MIEVENCLVFLDCRFIHLHTSRNTRLIVGDNHLITLSIVYCNNSRFDARQSYVSRHKFSNVPDRHLQTPSLIQPPQVDDPPRQLLELQDPSHLRFPLQEGMLGGNLVAPGLAEEGEVIAGSLQDDEPLPRVAHLPNTDTNCFRFRWYANADTNTGQ